LTREEIEVALHKSRIMLKCWEINEEPALWGRELQRYADLLGKAQKSWYIVKKGEK